VAHNLVQAPISLLCDPNLRASAKVIWLVERLRTPADPPGTGWLCTVSGLARPTVLIAKESLIAAGWAPTETGDRGATLPMPVQLLRNHKVGSQARILYALLPLTAGFSYPSGSYTTAELASLAHANPHTVIKAVSQLVRAEWITVTRAHRLARTSFDLTFPGLAKGMAALDEVINRLSVKERIGEKLMQSYLSILIDVEEFDDNARPKFLVNPRTGERFELDRYYSPTVGFEFNGPQHYRPTKDYSATQVGNQRERDFTKLGICVDSGVALVVVHEEDLTLKGMQAKVGSYLPLRDLTGYDMAIDYLEGESIRYRKSVALL
jgi:hypothetical protein